MWKIGVVVFDGVDEEGVADLLRILSTANSLALQRHGPSRLQTQASLQTASEHLHVTTSSGGGLVAEAALPPAPDSDVVWVPSGRTDAVAANPRVSQWLADARSAASIMVGIGAGCTVLAGAGLLRGTIAADRSYADDLLRLDPRLQLDRDSAFVDQDHLMTATTRGAEALALHLVARRAGATLARDVALHLGIDRGEASGIEVPAAAGEGLF